MNTKTNKDFIKATLPLSAIMSLRMLGLFMVLPIFSLYASQLTNATPALIGASLGIYGLTQALFQVPFGLLSDHFGRRKLIAIGLLIFILGSIICALSHSIYAMIIGRALQGTGAVGSTIIAMIADLTRPDQRTKAMAIMGMSIGFSFTLAIILGPMLSSWINVSGIFWLAAVLSILGLFILFTLLPSPNKIEWHADAEADLHEVPTSLKDPELFRFFIGVFILHLIFTATFVVVPISLHQKLGLDQHSQWWIYLPAMLGAFLLIIPTILITEKKSILKLAFLISICLLALAELFFWFFAKNLFLFAFGLLLFFAAFSILEAFLPSLVSKRAPAKLKGTALGIYSSSQFFGIFIGGMVGGWLYGKFGLINVYLFCVIVSLIWVTIARTMKTGDSKHGKRC